MIRKELLGRLARTADRRAFLKVLGAVGVGAAAGGVAQSVFKVIDVDDEHPTLSRTRTAMGTFVTITAAHPSRDRAEEATELAFDEMERLASILSRHDAVAPLAVLNEQGSLVGPPPDLSDVVLYSLDVYRGTGGVFDPTVMPLLDLLESAQGGRLPSEGEIRAVLDRVGADRVQFSDRRIEFERPGMSMTLDGVAKGYVVDGVSDVLVANGVADHIVDAGATSASGGGEPGTGRGRSPSRTRTRRGTIPT